MKTKFYYLSALMLGLFTQSCSSSDDPPATPVVFPTNEIVTVDGTATKTLTFNASHDSQLTCDKSWIRFVAGDPQEERETVNGVAGANTFQVLVKSTGADFTDQVATITMKMEGQEKVIYTVHRSALTRTATMVVYDGTNTTTPVEVNKLDILYKDILKYDISFTANFKWKLKSQPEWLEVFTKNIVGEPGVKVTTRPTMNRIGLLTDFLPFEQSGKFVIEDVNDATKTIEFAVTFDGMADDVTSFFPMNMGQGVGVTSAGLFAAEEDSKTIIAYTRNMVADVAYIQQSYGGGANTITKLTAAESWLKCVENPAKKGEYVLRADPNETHVERSIYLLFLPSKFTAATFDFDSVFPEGVYNRYYGIKVTQQGQPYTDPFTFLFRNFQAVDPMVVTSAEAYPDAALAAEFGVGTDVIFRKVFTEAEWVPGKNMVITTIFSGFDFVFTPDMGPDGISIYGLGFDETNNKTTLSNVREYADITRTVLLYVNTANYVEAFSDPGVVQYILVLEKE